MDDRALPEDVRRSLLRSVVPFGFVNVGALIAGPVTLAAIARTRVEASDLRMWVIAVWIGAIAQLALLFVRHRPLQGDPRLWERIYGWLEVYIGASWGAALAIEVTSGDPLTFHLMLTCFYMMCTAAGVVAFAGAPHIGRRFLVGLWLSVLTIAAAYEIIEIIAIAALIWPTAHAYLVFATRLMERSALQNHRSRELSRELAIQATTDELTALLNRRATLQRMQQLMATGHGVTALFIDLDGFKHINDSYGHAAGDTVLINVAERLAEVVRDEDIIGRIGGDEFIVVLTDPADQHLADVIAARLAGEIGRCHGAIHELAVTASIGAAQSIDGVTAEDLLGCADSAMYRAKAQGGNSAVHFLESHLD